MFWNKDKIPDLHLEDDEDLFRMDDGSSNVDNKNVDEYSDEKSKDTEDFYEEYSEEQEAEEIKNKAIDINLFNKIANIILCIIIIVGLLISIDIISVTRFEKGPFFALKTKTYNDGGTKEYHGLFYKVIKYQEKEGRVDTIIGSWNIKYDTTPININMLDLALNFNNNINNSLENYMDKYLKIEGEVSSINEDYITLKYKDDGKKYTTILKCNIIDASKEYKTGDKVKVVGTLYNYEKDDNLKLYMKNCYVKG